MSKSPKLSLRREALDSLTPEELTHTVGGGPTESNGCTNGCSGGATCMTFVTLTCDEVAKLIKGGG